jgi:hypothetical protein
MRRISLTAVALLGLLLSSCGSSTAAPKVSSNVPLRLLSVRGPAVLSGPDSLFVDTSLERLRQTVLRIKLFGIEHPDFECSPVCWPDAPDQAGVLYVAAQLPPSACVAVTVIHAVLSGPATLQLWADGKNVCPPGANSAALAKLVLMGVSVDDLPRKTALTVTLLNLPGQPPISSATVRLA